MKNPSAIPAASINVKPERRGGGGPRAYVGHLTSRDPYHVPDILDLKRGWMGINNAHAIFRMHNLFCVHCLCPSSLNSN